MIVQKNISKIPLKLPYICGTIKEQVKNIYDSKIVDTDLLKIGINNGYQQVISGPMAYISTIMVGYVPNKELYRLAMDGNTAAAEQLAARTKMDCITHTIFLAGGAFLEPIVNGFMRIPFVQRLIGSISGAVWELNNKVIASSELYQRYLLKQYAKEEVAKVCGYEVSKKISPELLDSIFKSGQASDIVAILSKYDDEAIVAINKILDKDAVAALIRDYGDDGVKVAVKGGDYLVKAINNLDDDVAKSFVKTASKQKDSFYDYLKSLDESYLNELVASSKADIDKISKWDYQPDYELYVRHKSVYDNPKYFEQEKGITIYPGTNGDTNINGFVDGIFETKTLEPGMIIDRYGSNGTGKYFSPLGTPYSERALPPYMKNEPYTKYKVLVSFEVKSGEIVPWFDEVGGGTQYLSTYLVDELKKFGYIVEVEQRIGLNDEY